MTRLRGRPGAALVLALVSVSCLSGLARAQAGAAAPLILATGGRSCQIHNAVLSHGEPFVRLSDVAACGGGAQVLRDGGVVVAESEGFRLTLWPWGQPVAVRNGLEVLSLPDDPWFWYQGGFYVRPEVIEAWLGGAVALKFAPEDLPIRYHTPLTYKTDLERPQAAVGLRILVDPGHGGDDLGALAADGTREKDVTLAVALRLANWLSGEGFAVRLTRADDSYPTLSDRVHLANVWDADLVVSIHCNSAPRKTARGIETYVMSRRASDPRALELAQFENAFDRKQTEGGDMLSAVLGDVARQAQENATTNLASVFHRRLIDGVGGENRGVRKAPLFVLAGATMPAFLVELGFLSNAEDAAQLVDPDHQLRLARSMGAAVVAITPYLKTRVAESQAGMSP